MFWCQLAETLGRPIVELKQTVPLSELFLWQVWFDRKPNRYEKQDYYLAQIAYMIYQTNSKKRGKVKDFLLRFDTPSRLSAKEMKRRVRAWLSVLGAGNKKGDLR